MFKNYLNKGKFILTLFFTILNINKKGKVAFNTINNDLKKTPLLFFFNSLLQAELCALVSMFGCR